MLTPSAPTGSDGASSGDGSSREVVDEVGELGRVERLGDVVVGAGLPAFPDLGVGRLGAEEHDGHLGGLGVRPQRAQDGVAVAARHHDVEHQHVGGDAHRRFVGASPSATVWTSKPSASRFVAMTVRIIGSSSAQSTRTLCRRSGRAGGPLRFHGPVSAFCDGENLEHRLIAIAGCCAIGLAAADRACTNIRSCPATGDDPARRPRRVLRVGRAARRSAAARPAR